MKAFFVSVVFTGLLAACTAPNQLYERSMEAASEKAYEGRQWAEGEEWFATRYQEYQPDKGVTDTLKANLEGVRVLAFAGKWCSDTRWLLPKYYKAMDAAGAPNEATVLIEVDRMKQDTFGLSTQHNILLVPTFIVYKDGRLRGRIVEAPAETIEKDLLKLVRD